MIGTLVAKRNVPKVYDALNRHDLEAFLGAFSEDAVFVYPGTVSLSGAYEGKEAIAGFFERWFEQFPTVRFTVEHVAVANLFDLTGSNVVTARWNVSLVNRDGLATRNSGVTVISLRRGKAVHVQDFFSDTGERFRAAWGEAEPGSSQPQPSAQNPSAQRPVPGSFML